MSFGSLLTDQSGVAFYIADTLPLTMLEKRVLNVPSASGEGSVQDLYANDGVMRFVFVNSTGAQGGSTETCEFLQLNGSNNRWQLNCRGAARTVNVFIFGYQFQPIPSWGIQINDSQGRCILTNETKVLRDVQNIGDSGNPNNSGYVINQTISGQWAVAPTMTGYFAGVNNSSGQPIPVVARFCSSARFNGNSTQIASGYLGNVDGNASSATYTNYRNRITAINVARY
ncbi:hypothetical protein [Pantoea sp. GM01]|uniref:hypothetical protein n=1 Tax=Pantoea sp. GM01 TaxID=1144320 RepID=UPI000270F85A|nr:hypothetical protein [Pantoea sp. GM01]EJL90207.1 hypothetical protein PMI17_01727 [Pantoea sp. GM01]